MPTVRTQQHHVGLVFTDYVLTDDLHTTLGGTALPNTLTALFTLSLHGGSIPDDAHTTPMLELLRVAANLCLDHGIVVIAYPVPALWRSTRSCRCQSWRSPRSWFPSSGHIPDRRVC